MSENLGEFSPSVDGGKGHRHYTEEKSLQRESAEKLLGKKEVGGHLDTSPAVHVRKW